MLVKICGIKTKEAAIAAAEAGADFVGFVFADSKRSISSDQAAEIAKCLPASVKKVGVFVNEAPDVMEQTVKKVGLDFIQLHGEEPPEVAENLPVKIIKAFPATSEALKETKEYPCDYILIDTPSKRRGGSGKAFDWELLAEMGVEREKLILAGGLTPENVQQAATEVTPFAVDVSSGVETAGEKDISKIQRFIHQAKQKEGLQA